MLAQSDSFKRRPLRVFYFNTFYEKNCGKSIITQFMGEKRHYIATVCKCVPMDIKYRTAMIGKNFSCSHKKLND